MVLSSSAVETCFRDGTEIDPVSGLNCSSKLIVLMSIENGDLGTTEFQATLQGANANGSSSSFAEPLKIKLSKTPVEVVYPLVYHRSVNGKPREDVMQLGWQLAPPACEDGTHEKPSCGWQKDPLGNNIAYSNGFCCRCSIEEVFNKDDTHRGLLDCAPMGKKMSSAHCLRFGDTWWDLFEVEPSTINYKINVEVSGRGLPTTLNLSMDHSTPFFTNPLATLSGRIVGDFGTPTSYPNYESYFLAIQRDPPLDPIVLGGVKNWLLIPKSMVDLTGTGCDKIGVSFQGFYSQASRCSLQAGSCLNNQLDDLWISDNDLRSANRTPKFMLQRWGNFKQDVDTSRQFDLRFLPRGITNTLFTLTVKADSIRFITNKSTGVIAGATILDFFTFSRDGILYVVLFNTGMLTATYFTTVTECTTPGILPIAAQQMSITSLTRYQTQFQLYSQNLFSSTDQCRVSLYNSAYELLDSVIVRFNTTLYERDKGNQGGNQTDNPLNSDFEAPSKITCSQKCPSFWNIPCFIVTGCWINVLWVVLAVVGMVAGLYLLFKTCLCIKPISAIVKRFSSGKSSPKKSRKRTSKRSKHRKHRKHRKLKTEGIDSRESDEEIESRQQKGSPQMKEPTKTAKPNGSSRKAPNASIGSEMVSSSAPSIPPRKLVRPQKVVTTRAVAQEPSESSDADRELMPFNRPLSRPIAPISSAPGDLEMTTFSKPHQHDTEESPGPRSGSAFSDASTSASTSHVAGTLPNTSNGTNKAPTAQAPSTPQQRPPRTANTPSNPLARQGTRVPIPISPLLDTIETPTRPRRNSIEESDSESDSQSLDIPSFKLGEHTLDESDNLLSSGSSPTVGTPPRIAIAGLTSLPGSPNSLPPPPVPRKPPRMSPKRAIRGDLAFPKDQN
jgi:hypothetical protein